MLPAPFSTEFLSRLECLRLRTRKEVLGSRPGSYSSPRRGTSLEFADYRRYSPGDDLRYLDWGVFARSDRLYLKLFREEVDLFAYLFIDASGSMSYPSPQEKFVPVCQVALSLAYVVLSNHDHVKIHLLKQPNAPPASPFYRGRHRIMDCADFLGSVTPEGSLELASSLGEHLKRIRRPGKAILISDFFMPPENYQQGLNLLRAFNLDISVVQVLSPLELEPPFPRGSLLLVDVENPGELGLQWSDHIRNEYRGRVERHNRELKSFCHQAGIVYSVFLANGSLPDFVLQTLPSIGLFK